MCWYAASERSACRGSYDYIGRHVGFGKYIKPRDETPRGFPSKCVIEWVGHGGFVSSNPAISCGIFLLVSPSRSRRHFSQESHHVIDNFRTRMLPCHLHTSSCQEVDGHRVFSSNFCVRMGAPLSKSSNLRRAVADFVSAWQARPVARRSSSHAARVSEKSSCSLGAVLRLGLCLRR